MFYEMAKAGVIRDCSLKKPGAVRGKRLFWLPSIMAHLDRAATATHAAREVRP